MLSIRQKINSMVKVSFNLNGNTIVMAERVDFDSAVNLRFHDVDDSISAYNKLKDNGIEVFHAGKNNPEGPSVMFYPDGKTKISLWSH